MLAHNAINASTRSIPISDKAIEKRHKEERVSIMSKVPFSHLDENEQVERLSNMKYDRKLINRKLRRATEKLAKEEETCKTAEKNIDSFGAGIDRYGD